MSELPTAVKPEQSTERPFPWHCPHCRRKEVTRMTIPYQCQRLHNGRTVTVSIPQLAVPRCANCGQLVFDYVAEEQINQAVRAFLSASAEPLNGADKNNSIAPVETSATPPV